MYVILLSSAIATRFFNEKIYTASHWAFHWGPLHSHFNVFCFCFFRNHFNVSSVGKIGDISLEIVDVLSIGVYINQCQKIYFCLKRMVSSQI